MSDENLFRCFACGRWTNEVKGGPSSDEVSQVCRWTTGVLDVDGRAGVTCWECFWKTDLDLWISESCWNRLNPIISFENLPQLIDDVNKCWDPIMYPYPKEVVC